MAEHRIDSLKRQRDQLNARIQKLDAAKKSKGRKEDTRRKILMGAYSWEQAKQNKTEKALYQQMIDFLDRESDKKLFHILLEDTHDKVDD